MRSFRRLAVVTIAATFVLIAVWGLVRATDSGLGCPDWPRCFGRLVPPAELHPWIEHSHRLIASLVMVLVALLVVAAWRTGQERVVRRASVAALVMVLAQAVIGAFVVWWKLRADSVTLHLATALALVALLIYIGFRARYPSGDRTRRQGQDRGFVRLAGAWADRQKVPPYNLFYADLEADAKARVLTLMNRTDFPSGEMKFLIPRFKSSLSKISGGI